VDRVKAAIYVRRDGLFECRKTPSETKNQAREEKQIMLVSKDNDGNIIGWRETYFSADETVNVSVTRNISTITTRDKTTGKVESKTFFGTPLLPPDSGKSK
jgi:hypothetical protein